MNHRNEKLIKECNDLKALLSASTEFRGGLLDTVAYILNERDALKRGLNRENEAVSQLSEITKMLVESSMMRRNINSSVQALIEIATAPDTTQPQLNEIRYVLHGDIQPCTVLYSDDTTTLLRLDEGDIMCETDTIEWSDSVTYRCQELLRGFVGLTTSATLTASAMKGMARAMAQLVRDERILLNDDALETDAYVQYVKGSSSPMTRKEWEQAGRPTSPAREWTDNNSPTPLR